MKRAKRGSRLIEDYFPGYSTELCDDNLYVRFQEFGRDHIVRVHEDSVGKYVKYMGDRYYLGGKYV